MFNMPYRKARTHPGTSTGCWHSVLHSRATLSCPTETLWSPEVLLQGLLQQARNRKKYHKMMCLSRRNQPEKSLTGEIWDMNGYAHTIRQHQTQKCPQSAKVPIFVGLAFGAAHLLQLLGPRRWRVSLSFATQMIPDGIRFISGVMVLPSCVVKHVETPVYGQPPFGCFLLSSCFEPS